MGAGERDLMAVANGSCLEMANVADVEPDLVRDGELRTLSRSCCDVTWSQMVNYS